MLSICLQALNTIPALPLQGTLTQRTNVNDKPQARLVREKQQYDVLRLHCACRIYYANKNLTGNHVEFLASPNPQIVPVKGLLHTQHAGACMALVGAMQTPSWSTEPSIIRVIDGHLSPWPRSPQILRRIKHWTRLL